MFRILWLYNFRCITLAEGGTGQHLYLARWIINRIPGDKNPQDKNLDMIDDEMRRMKQRIDETFHEIQSVK